MPRFEFRTFGQNFGISEQKIRKLSGLEKIRESSEIYIVSAGTDENNIKVCNAWMDIKVFVKEEKGLEQWNSRMKASFPMKVKTIEDEVFPAFGVKVPQFEREEYTLDQFLAEIVRPHAALVLVNMFKRRFSFTVNECISEIAELLINGAYIKTIKVESEDVEAVLKSLRMLSLDKYENINYLKEIKRVVSMVPMPGLAL